MKNTKAIKSTIIFAFILLVAVFMLINVLTHSHATGNHGRGNRGFQQNAWDQQGINLQNKGQQNPQRLCRDGSDCSDAVNEHSLSCKQGNGKSRSQLIAKDRNKV